MDQPFKILIIMLLAVLAIIIVLSLFGVFQNGPLGFWKALCPWCQSQEQTNTQTQKSQPVQNAPLAPPGAAPSEQPSSTPEIEDLPSVTTDIFVDLHTHPDVIRERYPSAVIDDYGRASQKSLPTVTDLSPESSVLWYSDDWECRVVMPAKADPEPSVKVFLEFSSPPHADDDFLEISQQSVMPSQSCQKKRINGKEKTICAIDTKNGLGGDWIPSSADLRVRCGVVVDGVEYQSKAVNMEKVVYFVLGDYGSFDLLGGFNFFLKRTVLQKGDFKIIDLNGKCANLIPNDKDSCIKPESIIDCLVAGNRLYIKEKDVVIFFIPGNGRAHCHTDVLTDSGPRAKSVSVIQMYEGSRTTTLAHELGHSYGFGDEYDYNLFNYVEGLNRYPSCCLDAPNNPDKIRLGLENLFGSILNGSGRIDNCVGSGGTCTRAWPCVGENLKLSSNDCQQPARCCLPFQILGNNCYPKEYALVALNRTKSSYTYNENSCAGMPLDSLGLRLEDLNAPYRSIMGSNSWLIDYGFDPAKLIYPAPKSGVSVSEIWPLRPGAPR